MEHRIIHFTIKTQSFFLSWLELKDGGMQLRFKDLECTEEECKQVLTAPKNLIYRKRNKGFHVNMTNLYVSLSMYTTSFLKNNEQINQSFILTEIKEWLIHKCLTVCKPKTAIWGRPYCCLPCLSQLSSSPDTSTALLLTSSTAEKIVKLCPFIHPA